MELVQITIAQREASDLHFISSCASVDRSGAHRHLSQEAVAVRKAESKEKKMGTVCMAFRKLSRAEHARVKATLVRS